jgi:hypothetical protein
MKNDKKAKHNKIRNTGLLFEFLLRQVTADLISKDSDSAALQIIKERFSEKTELGKELLLYNALLNQKFNTDKKADYFISEVLTANNKANKKQLKREKFNVIKEISEEYDLRKLFSSKIPNYKVYASIYKLFEHSNNLTPEEKTITHFNLIENITTQKPTLVEEVKSLPEDGDLRVIAYRILLEKFNAKYKDLNQGQKTLLKHYINNVSNTSSLKDYITESVPKLKKQLKRASIRVTDKITKIKLTEAINSMGTFCKVGSERTVPDKIVIQMMRYYELLKALNKVA